MCTFLNFLQLSGTLGYRRLFTPNEVEAEDFGEFVLRNPNTMEPDTMESPGMNTNNRFAQENIGGTFDPPPPPPGRFII